MSHATWFLLVGGLLVAMGISYGAIRRLPITSAIIYLAVGLLMGPTLFKAYHFNPLQQSALLEVLTEVAVLISLYAAGVKMPAPLALTRWRTPILLATLSMGLTVALVAAFGMLVLDMPLGLAVLLGAIVAPTDPVLATDVQIRHPRDHDRLRFHLTCEAGMNDGTAFPMVMLGLGLLGLHDIGEDGLRWLSLDVAWATAAGIGVGLVLGASVARLIALLHRPGHVHGLLHDFIGLGLVGLVYGVVEWVQGWGFLAVFFAAVAFRQTEVRLYSGTIGEACAGVEADGGPEPLTRTQVFVSEGSLVFKEHIERLSEVVLILLVGGSLFLDSWSWRAVSLALFLFLVARPASVFLGLLPSRTPTRIRAMAGWFGVRGIGSLYYLMFAIQHGLPEEQALELIHLVLIVVTLSILFHGISVKPLMRRFRRRGPDADPGPDRPFTPEPRIR